MAYIGKNPKWNTGGFTPQSTEPANPVEGMVYYDDGSNRAEGLYVYKNGQWTTVGAGSSGINYIENGDAEAGVTGWSAYADAAAAAPADGTGGSPTTTITASTSSPLRGVSSLLITKDAADRQGEGASYDFSIDSADQAKILRLSFDYESSTNFADGDIRAYIYDITNTQLIEVTERDVAANSQGRYIGEFQTNSNSTSYRLILHIASTNASAYTLKFDNVQVGPRDIARGSVVTDWQSYTPTVANLGTVTNVDFAWRRVGANIEIRGYLTSGTVSGGTVTFTPPSGISLTDPGTANNRICGSGHIQDATVGEVSVFVNTSTEFGFIDANYTGVTGTTWGNTTLGSFILTAQVEGWSANSEISTDFGNRQVVAEGAGNGGASITANVTNVTFTETRDTTSSFDGQIFTAPESGDYQVEGCMLATATITNWTPRFYVNGSEVKSCGREDSSNVCPISGIINLEKGDQLSIRSGSAFTESNNSTFHHIFIHKLANPQTLIGSETVAARYSSDAAQAVSNATVVDFEDADFDTHSAVTTGASWNFAAPISGIYEINVTMRTDNVAFSADENFGFEVRKNASAVAQIIETTDAAGTANLDVTGSCLVQLSEGDTIDIRFVESVGAVNLASSGLQNFIEIKKL